SRSGSSSTMSTVGLVMQSRSKSIRASSYLPAGRIGEHQAKQAAAAGPGFVQQRRAVRLRKLPGEEQAEPGATLAAREERLEDAIDVGRAHALAAIADLEERPRTRGHAAGTHVDHCRVA